MNGLIYISLHFQYHKELDRLITGRNYRQMLSDGVISFSVQWMKWGILSNASDLIFLLSFVLKFCDRGRGLKPDWATKGIEFLHFSANPDFTKYITDQEFEVSWESQVEIVMISVKDFKTLTEKCHSHVMGESAGTPERRQSVSPSVESKGNINPQFEVAKHWWLQGTGQADSLVLIQDRVLPIGIIVL